MGAQPLTHMIDTTQDPRTNRVEDSLLLWKQVISNKLLANVNIILFLNKVRNICVPAFSYAF